MKNNMTTLTQYIQDCGSLAKAATRLEISVGTLNNWRKGKFKPSDAMIRWLRTKGVNPDWSIVEDKFIDKPIN